MTADKYPRVAHVGDPVVVRGRKYRIRRIVDERDVELRTSFGGHETTVDMRQLEWDPVVGVWRGER